ncbi:putative resolvase [Caldanaerobacter subterraneus subsp. tengcongensis MB4]|uniref:Predicted site-specific integrase-resolvase n=1 Tax=Caldanaerobacter subterraneus subsp. tengcongensis (strain DSM 15242 / JCM 11007 / NBRC 100824 / MB4) TaxID=273068 RepID=Q8RBW7_CALS4|nr:IS607 family transposase [Caldanaerobacter subterraneus]AAM23953.1 predicted site-specific integrase-resolvase [Caldanaerobacter subterraneus subsp. tengcongensis MB4]MCS3916533.1 putative resolvase [Caldanaerobacter subterraneus subsp. tengcongensis MB4]
MLLTIKKVKELYDISRITLINWEKEGLITPIRTPKGRRRYKKEDIEKLLGMLEEKPKPKVVLYARVSTKKQEEYLKNQIRRLEEYANSQGWQYEVISEIASGVNENRRGLLKLLNKIKRGEVEKVVVEYPDRLARFGFEYLKFFMESLGVELIVLSGEENKEEMNKELAEDLIAIVTSFAARIYGQRGGKKHAGNPS